MAIRLFLGRRGNGKTTLGYFVSLKSPVRMIFDPRGLIRSEASVVATTSDEIRDGALALIDGEITELVVTPSAAVDVRFKEFCKAAARFIKAHPHKAIAVMIDEVRFVDVRDENLDWIMRTSNIDRVQIIFTGHRPKDIPTDIRAIADTWSLFQFTLGRDIDVIEEQTSPAVARDVQRLAPRCFIEWDDAHGSAKSYSNPAQWYVRLHSADDEPAAPTETGLEPDKKRRESLWDDD